MHQIIITVLKFLKEDTTNNRNLKISLLSDIFRAFSLSLRYWQYNVDNCSAMSFVFALLAISYIHCSRLLAVHQFRTGFSQRLSTTAKQPV